MSWQAAVQRPSPPLGGRSLARRLTCAVTAGSKLVMAAGGAFVVCLALLQILPPGLAKAVDLRGMLGAVVLYLLAVPLISFMVKDPAIAAIARIGLGLKLASAIVRIYVAFDLYGGAADAGYYHSSATSVAEQLGRGSWTPSSMDIPRLGEGTRHLAYLLGWVYKLLGPNLTVGFLVFSWLGFVGLLCFYKAAELALPQLARRSYARLLFFLPSLLFWPSSMGKESWMMLCLGSAALGVALVRQSQRFPLGLGLLIAGISGAGFIRPHMALLTVLAAVGALVLAAGGRGTFGVRAGSVLVGLALAATSFGKTQEYAAFYSPPDQSQTLSQVAYLNTQQGGSRFEAAPVRNAFDFPLAVLTVLYRPFPFEARGLTQLTAATEGTFLLALTWRRRRVVWGALRQSRHIPHLAFAVLFSVGFVIAFSNIANFGILARQRVQLYPLVLLLLCISPNRKGSIAD